MSRFTVDFGPKMETMLADLAQREETTKTEIIRRAVAVYDCLKREIGEAGSGRKLSITNERDEVLKDVLLP